MKDGLSQYDRFKRIQATGSFSVFDNRMDTLLQQAEQIAGWIRYYGLDSKPDGYFDELLDEIKLIRKLPHSRAKFGGDMEPGQALLYTFLSQLHIILERFNQRWKDYSQWYINQILGVESDLHKPDYTWISFVKSVPQKLLITRNTGFSYDKANPNTKVFYRLTEDVEVNSITVNKVLIVRLEKLPDIFPENLFGCPTGLSVEDLSDSVLAKNTNPVHQELDEDRLPLGISISSPSLLLREGKRYVTLGFKPEKSTINSFRLKRYIVRLIIEVQKNSNQEISRDNAKEIVLIDLIHNIFDLEISTAIGWTKIKKYVVETKGKRLCVRFNLDESFPATTLCNEPVHGIATSFPVLKIFLNHDSWLFAYAWLKDFFIQKIEIETKVERATHLLFYNQLGEVDISKPFSPFGFSATRDAWFVLGNYEMAIKRTKSIDVHIKWQQLPQDETGLQSYYESYQQNIDNLSFQLRSRYLSDYNWTNTKNGETIYLFSSVLKDISGNPVYNSKLQEDHILKKILLEDAEPIRIPENEYQYNLRAKTGFVNFSLVVPEMGFGEKVYQQLFATSLIKKKKKLINAPINPLIERITLTYESDDSIDLTRHSFNEDNQVYHIHPLGIKQIYPAKENIPHSFVLKFDADTNILLALDNVVGNEYVNLYLELLPLKNEIDLSCPPLIAWYWGNGYYWERLPDTAILRNTTQNLLTSGMIRLYIPEIESDDFRDADGLVWIRLSIVENATNIAGINRIFSNVAKVKKENVSGGIKEADYKLNCTERKLPGIEKIVQITPFLDTNAEESDVNKLIRVSEYITHRGRAVTARDYERMALQAFPEVRKIKCLPGVPASQMVTLVVIPVCNTEKESRRPRSSPELLLKIESYFSNRTSGMVKRVNAVNPVYEKITVRCELKMNWTNNSKAVSRAVIAKLINAVIAPWQRKNETPEFGYSFSVGQLRDKLSRMKQVDEISQLSVIQLIQTDGLYHLKEYMQPEDRVVGSCAGAILVPAAEHYILSDNKRGLFGLNEMEMDENFVIWQSETEKR
jgi:hypothetical protein